MSLNEFTSGNNGTRAIQAGDTPDIQDDYAVSVAMATENVSKGNHCYIVGGFVENALFSKTTFPVTPCVPTESKDNSSGNPGDKEIRIILPGQMVAIKPETAFTVGQYAGIKTGDSFEALNAGAVNTAFRKFARYVGKEGAIFSRDGTTPYTEVLSGGIVPDQDLANGEIGWFQLTESAF